MLTPKEICDATIKTGIKKANSSTLQLIVLGFLAGAFIALGAYGASMAAHAIENPSLAKIAAGAIFPAGLMFVLICGGELFTGNILMGAALVDKKISLKGMLRNWIIIYFANLVGAVFIAFMVYESGLLDTNLGKLGGYAIKVAAYKGGLTFTKAFASGILCNIVVCLAVWGAYAAKDVVGKVFMIWFPIMLFVIAGFEHCIANMYYFSISLFAKTNEHFIEASHVKEKIANVDLSHAIGNIIPATLGNIVGGFVFVAVAYWVAYKFADKSNEKGMAA